MEKIAVSEKDFYQDNVIVALTTSPQTFNFEFRTVGVTITCDSGTIRYSFDGGTTFHRLDNGESFTYEKKGYTEIIMKGDAGAEAYRLDAW